MVYERKRRLNEWERLIHGMKVRGLKLSEAQEKLVMDEIDKNLTIKE